MREFTEKESKLLQKNGIDKQELCNVLQVRKDANRSLSAIIKYLEEPRKTILLNATQLTSIFKCRTGYKNFKAVLKHGHFLRFKRFSIDEITNWALCSNKYISIEMAVKNFLTLEKLKLSNTNIYDIILAPGGKKKLEYLCLYSKELREKEYDPDDLTSLLLTFKGPAKINVLLEGKIPVINMCSKIPVDVFKNLYHNFNEGDTLPIGCNYIEMWEFESKTTLGQALTLQIKEVPNYSLTLRNKEALKNWFLSKGIIFSKEERSNSSLNFTTPAPSIPHSQNSAQLNLQPELSVRFNQTIGNNQYSFFGSPLQPIIISVPTDYYENALKEGKMLIHGNYSLSCDVEKEIDNSPKSS